MSHDAVRSRRPAPPPIAEPRSRRAGLPFAIALIALYLLLAVNLWWKIGLNDIERFDEARHAVNAYEMLRSGDFIANRYRGALDYWNLKPPLSFWIDIASFKVLGFTTVALRLPSMLAAFGTTGLVTVASRRLGGRLAAVVAAASMVTCYQLITTHAWRTGDPDALFVLFLTAGLFALLAARWRPWLLLVTTTGFSLAFLTKSFHAGLLLVFAIGYLLVVHRRSAVRLRHVVSLLGFLPIAAWAAARYAFDGTRFFVGMVHEDLITRSSTPIEGNSGSPLYYVRLLAHFYGVWLALLALAAVALLLARRRRATARPALQAPTETIALLAWAALVVIAFSAVATKLPWYTLPAYPALAVVVGVVAATLLGLRLRWVAVAVVGATIVSAGVSEAFVAHAISAVRADPIQQTLAALHREPRYRLEAVYLDPDIHGGWQQRVASAELSGDLVPRNGGYAAFERGGKGLIIVRKNGATDREHTALRSSVVAQTASYFVAHR